MALSVAVFSVTTVMTPTRKKHPRKRLFNIQLFACVFMVVATYLMFKHRNEWVLAMVSAAVCMIYAAIVLPKELAKEKEQ